MLVSGIIFDLFVVLDDHIEFLAYCRCIGIGECMGGSGVYDEFITVSFVNGGPNSIGDILFFDLW